MLLFKGALIGCGASLFGIGSDIAGSIRVPALFNGIFGHKPTGGLLSIVNHFPYSTDECFSNYLVVGPMCRYAKDLPTLLHIMAGKKADKLRLNEPLYTKDIKVNICARFFIFFSIKLAEFQILIYLHHLMRHCDQRSSISRM